VRAIRAVCVTSAKCNPPVDVSMSESVRHHFASYVSVDPPRRFITHGETRELLTDSHVNGAGSTLVTLGDPPCAKRGQVERKWQNSEGM